MSTTIADSLLALDYDYSWGTPLGCASVRCRPEDFVVEERFDPALTGAGDHLYLRVRKRNQNTIWVVEGLARRLGVEPRDVGYCGLKDRRALSSQWFSVRVLDQDADHLAAQWAGGRDFLPECALLAWGRHQRKLRHGAHRGNDFLITLRRLDAPRQALEERLAIIKARGVPNYFGEQRFGREGANLRAADRLLARLSGLGKSRGARDGRAEGGRAGSSKEGLYLSAARSHLFNRVLSARVRDGSWRTPERSEPVTTGPLWGRGRPATTPELQLREQAILAPYDQWCHALEHLGLAQERRPLVLAVEDFQWRWRGENLELGFGLPPGSYATAVLRELVFTRGPEDDAML